jgi:1-deoxy-D-xylulose-5-phosphate synthase
MGEIALDGGDLLAAAGIPVGVVNCRFVKPLDERLLASLAGRYRQLVTLEENVLAGGFGAAVDEWRSRSAAAAVTIHNLGIPDRFITHGARSLLLKEVGLDAASVAAFTRRLVAVPASTS